MNLLNSLKGLKLFLSNTKVFHLDKIVKNKSVAVIGAADSAFKKELGSYIDSFDYIIRVNRGAIKLDENKKRFVGTRTDILFHSFFEFSESGGGPIDLEILQAQNNKFLVNPNSNIRGLRIQWNYYKRNLTEIVTYYLPYILYKSITKNLNSFIPTVGFSALYTVLNSNCSKLYISGFTFFKTPYADDYRDNLKDVEKNFKFIEKQGLHNPDLELAEFLRQFNKNKNRIPIEMDPDLEDIVKRYGNF
ncbi:glycosyltransferase family 29 protein [Gillisia marina]|uniref:glycosyltransferase family 29 protein n=1 Tax=Gillisia marina TaxID=1167637 RepID=UPI000299E976|nr:glycosyltransferase family 29 protein [Gillisia marina]